MESTRPLDAASGRYLIELGASLGPIEAVQAHLLRLLGMLLPVLVACAAGGGYLLVGGALRPVDRISQSAELMSLRNLEARLAGAHAERRRARPAFDFTQSHARAAARIGTDLAPISGRRIA